MLPVGLALYRNRPEHQSGKDFGRVRRADAADTLVEGPVDGLTLAEATRTIDFWYLTALTLLGNAVNTALLLDHGRAMGQAGVDRGLSIALLASGTAAQSTGSVLRGVRVHRVVARPLCMLRRGPPEC